MRKGFLALKFLTRKIMVDKRSSTETLILSVYVNCWVDLVSQYLPLKILHYTTGPSLTSNILDKLSNRYEK